YPQKLWITPWKKYGNSPQTRVPSTLTDFAQKTTSPTISMKNSNLQHQARCTRWTRAGSAALKKNCGQSQAFGRPRQREARMAAPFLRRGKEQKDKLGCPGADSLARQVDGLASGQHRQRGFAEGAYLVDPVVAKLGQPLRILQQGTPDRDQVELVPGHALEQVVDAGLLHHRVVRRGEGAGDEILGQPDAAHGDGRQPGDLAGPAGQVELRAREFRHPEAAGGGVEDVDPGPHQRQQEALQLLRGPGQLGLVILLLPLRVAEHDGEVLSGGVAHRLDDLDGE